MDFSRRVTWQATVFWNQLHDAIANVTLPPPATNLQMRENAGDINAYGVEFDARYPVNDWAALTAAFDDVNASLNGNQPQQAPRWTVTAGLELKPLARLTVAANLRYEGRRFSDDINTPALALDAATTFDARISYALDRQSVGLCLRRQSLQRARRLDGSGQPLTTDERRGHELRRAAHRRRRAELRGVINSPLGGRKSGERSETVFRVGERCRDLAHPKNASHFSTSPQGGG